MVYGYREASIWSVITSLSSARRLFSRIGWSAVLPAHPQAAQPHQTTAIVCNDIVWAARGEVNDVHYK